MGDIGGESRGVRENVNGIHHIHMEKKYENGSLPF